MDLKDMLDLCAASSKDDWNVMTCWGAGSGPSYLDHFAPGIYGGEFELRHNEHSMRASYRPNIGVGIAWGLAPDDFFPDSDEGFETEWSKRFADSNVSVQFVDFFYYGSLVHREHSLVVDGGRAYLPSPTSDNKVSQWQYDFFAMLDSLEKLSDFATYVEQAGFTIA